MPLTDTAIRNAKSREKPVKLFDEGGLYLILTPTGARWWRLDYRYGGKRRTLSMGIYPHVSLKDARAKRDAARKLLAQGTDPSAVRKAQKATEADSFEAVAREWYGKHARRWVPGHSSKIIRRLELDLFPSLGDRPVGQITAPELLACIRRIEPGAQSRPRTEPCAIPGRSSPTPSRPAAPSAIRQPTSAARCNPP